MTDEEIRMEMRHWAEIHVYDLWVIAKSVHDNHTWSVWCRHALEENIQRTRKGAICQEHKELLALLWKLINPNDYAPSWYA